MTLRHRIASLIRGMFGKPSEFKRPTFPVEAKYTETRGQVNNVKPLFKKRIEEQPPTNKHPSSTKTVAVDYERAV